MAWQMATSSRASCTHSLWLLLLTILICRLERIIRDLVAVKDHQRVHDILEQLCNEFAYAVHQPHARNGGLIGLAAAAIALGPVSFV
jgi:hypothetical protein